MPVYGIQAGGVSKITEALEAYKKAISTNVLKDTEAALKQAVKGDSSIRSYQTTIKEFKEDIHKELTSYIDQTIRSLSQIETAYRINDQTSGGTIKKS